MGIKKAKDIKLVVQPVACISYHKYVFEGPCRFGAGETLTEEFDRMVAAQSLREFRQMLVEYIEPDADFEMLEPVVGELNEDFFVTEPMMAELTKNEAKVDVYLFTALSGRSYPLILELAARTKKPIVAMVVACDKTQVPAMLRSRGLECICEQTWEEAVEKMKLYRLRKVVKQTKMMLVTRGYKDAAMVSACDGFINLDEACKVFGCRYHLVDVHELIDHTHSAGSFNPTTPTRDRDGLNLTAEDMAEIEAKADELIAGAISCNMKKAEIINSLRLYQTVKKSMEHFECNAFSAPCPEMCATTRLNAEHITPCLTHSLLNGEGIPSACEYDIPGLVCQIMLSACNHSGAYMGNCLLLKLAEDGKTVATAIMPSNDIQDKVDGLSPQQRKNLVLTYHSSINLQMVGFDAEPLSYSIANYTGSGWGVTLRHDFRENAGQKLTMARISPDAKTLFVARGTIVSSVGESMTGCTQGVLFSVEDGADFFHKQCNVGNHVPMVFGDCFEQIVELGKLFGLNIVTA